MTVFCTVRQESEITIVIQKSRFIGRCYPVATEDIALEILARIRKKHYDARHNCFAYIIGTDNITQRYSDDGEPAGTAGLPIIEAMRQNRLVNAIVIVTRYFGGILLGAGGLVRAYSSSASEAIVKAKPGELNLTDTFRITFPYSIYASLENHVISKGYKLLEPVYGENVTAKILVREEHSGAFIDQVKDISSGKVVPELISKSLEVWDQGL